MPTVTNQACALEPMPGLSLGQSSAIPLAIVVPCYNEAESASKLRRNLERLIQALSSRYVAEVILVDDGSEDGTPEVLEREFAGFAGARIVKHENNRGIAAAIATGIQAANAEIVCSIDADCSYDPVQVVEMLPLLADDVALVVASPYHPLGRVNNVAPWRLRLSKAASGLYRLVLRQKLHTYTSCFRVYRRSMVEAIRLQNSGFVGVAELVCLLDRQGAKIIECPATLDVRTTGQSKMRILRAGCAHLKLIVRAGLDRLLRRRSPSLAHQLHR